MEKARETEIAEQRADCDEGQKKKGWRKREGASLEGGERRGEARRGEDVWNRAS